MRSLDLEAAAGVGRLDVVKSFFIPNGKLRVDATAQQMTDGLLVAAGSSVEHEGLAEAERGFPIARTIDEDSRMRAALGAGR